MIFNPFWRGARTPQVRSFTPDETLSYNAESQILSAVPPVSPYGSGTTTGSNTGDQIAATVPYDDTSTVLGATNVQGAIEALDALIGGAGTGDVVGPGVAVNDHVVFFDGTTGKLIKDSGLTLSGTNTGDQVMYTDENAQDAVGAMVDATLVYVDATPLLTRGHITGDVDIPQASNTSTLANSGVSAATYGDATHVAQVTFDAKGRATGAASVAISGLYSDEQAQDAIGTILTGLSYNDSTPSISAIRVAQIQVSDPNGSAITTGDGKAYFRVNSQLNGYNLSAVAAALTTVSSSGIPTVQIANVTDAVDMLSTKLTIDANETDSSTAATPAVIDGAHDDVATADMLRIDIDVAGTGAKGLMVELTFTLP